MSTILERYIFGNEKRIGLLENSLCRWKRAAGTYPC